MNSLVKEIKIKEEYDKENENNLITIEPISLYVQRKKEKWKQNKNSNTFSMEEFAKSICILTATQRKKIKKQIKDKCDLPIIKYNFIPESISDIKDIL